MTASWRCGPGVTNALAGLSVVVAEMYDGSAEDSGPSKMCAAKSADGVFESVEAGDAAMVHSRCAGTDQTEPIASDTRGRLSSMHELTPSSLGQSLADAFSCRPIDPP